MGVNSRSLREIANDIADHLDAPNGRGHDVSNEPRVPKGHGNESGEWTSSAGGGDSGREPTVTIRHADGSVEVRKGGTRAWRNNNPGNIEAGSRANSLGAIGSDGRFAIFPDEATGEAALEAELNSSRYSSLTIDRAIEKRTPSKEKGNNTEQTKALIKQISGLSGQETIDQLSPIEKQRLYNAIRRTEGWRPGSASNDMY